MGGGGGRFGIKMEKAIKKDEKVGGLSSAHNQTVRPEEEEESMMI
jgi:hypothetical protein